MQEALADSLPGDTKDAEASRQRSRPQVRVSAAEVRCFHESGHVVVHQFYGHRVVEVKAGSDAEACCKLAPQDVESFAYIVACCAGRGAVDQLYGWKATSDDNWQASNDYANAFKVALQVSEGDAQAARLLVEWGERMADVLSVRLWPQIHKLAFKLLEHDRLSSEQIRDALAQAR